MKVLGELFRRSGKHCHQNADDKTHYFTIPSKRAGKTLNPYLEEVMGWMKALIPTRWSFGWLGIVWF